MAGLMFPEGTSEQEQRDFIKHDALISEGLCPNGHGPMIQDNAFDWHCPSCPFQYHRMNIVKGRDF